MAGALTSQIPVGHPPQFLINRRNQLVQGGVVAIAPGNQLLSDLMWRGVIHVCTRGRGKIFYRHGSFYACLSRYSTVRRKPQYRAHFRGDKYDVEFFEAAVDLRGAVDDSCELCPSSD